MSNYIEIEKSESFEMIYPLIEASYNDIKEFAKKKPDGIVNKLKINMINRLFEKARYILEEEPSIVFLDILDDELLPQNSDVVIILGQYISALDQFRKKYYYWDSDKGAHLWRIT